MRSDRVEKMKTRITELLGIEVPIIQGAMARIADGKLAAAVSEAGGLGIIACGGAPAEWVREQVSIARSITNKPLGANVMLMDPGAAQTAELLTELGIDVITTGAGSPANFLPMWKEAGIKVIPVVASTALAQRMERLGVDAVVAEGTESGGHIGELTTMALVPSVCSAVSIPVIGAGGIANGRGIVAAFALGAEAVQMGTRFLMAAHGDELEQMYLGSLKRAIDGDVDNGSMMAGQIAALVQERKTAQEVIDELMDQARAFGALDLEQMAQANASRGE